MEQGDQTSNVAHAGPEPHWHEYRVGFMGELASMFSRTLGALAVGAVLSFIVVFVPAFALEDSSVTDLLSHAGVGDDDVEAVAQTADYLARMSTTPVALLVFFGAAGLCLGSCVRDVAVSRSVSDAAAAGASRKAVPTPQQVESITTVRFKRLWWFLLFGAVPSAFILIPIATIVLREAPLLSLAIVAFFIGIAMGYVHLHKRVEPNHQYRRITIAEHWTTGDEQAVWDRAQAGNASSPDKTAESAPSWTPWKGDRRVKIGGSLIFIGVAIGVFGIQLLYVTFNVMYPEANRLTKRIGPRADYAPWFENIIGAVLGLLALAFAAMIVLVIAGALVEGAGRRAERRELRSLIDDPKATHPPQAVLARYGLRHPAYVAQGLAIMAALFITCGTATVILGTFDYDVFPGAVETFRPVRFAATIALILGIALFFLACAWNAVRSIRGRNLRNDIIARWLSPPARTTDIRGREILARVGPTLTWQAQQDHQAGTIW